MTIKACPNPACEYHKEGKKDRFYSKWGYFKPKWNNKPVPRYRCNACGKSFSSSTANTLTKNEKRPDINKTIFDLYCSRMSLRRIAKHLGVNKNTVLAKFYKLGNRAWEMHEKMVKDGSISCGDIVVIDEMETYEGCRMKPFSIALAVDGDNGRVLDVAVSEIPAKGKIAARSEELYGKRANNSSLGILSVLTNIKTILKRAPAPIVMSDEKRAYRNLIKHVMPEASHVPVKSRAHKAKYSAIWWLNHACAMFRHDLSRLSRRSMVHSKDKDGLRFHLYLYIAWSNGYELFTER